MERDSGNVVKYVLIVAS